MPSFDIVSELEIFEVNHAVKTRKKKLRPALTSAVKTFLLNSMKKNKEIKKGEVYVIPSDRDLVQVIEKAKLQELKLGDDYGIVSYNETPLKKIVENGITTISTDFEAMGKILAQMILKGKKEKIENKSALINRNSL